MKSYLQNMASDFDAQVFRHPSAEYRGAPFWAWNTTLKEAQLLQQIDTFKRMGMGGFHMHARTGLGTEYLGQEFLQMVRVCTQKAREEEMMAWLYDEDRWPSGAAGGIVTREPQFRARHLLWTPFPYGSLSSQPERRYQSRSQSFRTGQGTLLARYQVVLQQGYLLNYRKLEETEAPPAEGAVWYAYLETEQASPWFNHQTYVDTLNKAAITRFIETTHERYAATVGDFFGTTIPAIFTDEPQFSHKGHFRHADERRDVLIPWTTDFLESYQETYGYHLEEALPELFWELPEHAPSLARYRYHDHLCERFTTAFADTLGAWCQNHQLLLTGHMMEEPTLTSQTAALGEAMRSYRSFGLPGIDMLCDRHEYTTVKQAQSAAHQYGRAGVLSELYGVTNWDFTFVGHKAQGDWQAALGVTTRVHHLTWVSMAGEAKRDYPASIGAHSPWHGQYRLIEDHFARLNTVLTRGQALVRVGVLHPIESFWLCFGPLEQTAMERDEREQAFAHLTEWLLFGLIDFDFIAESLLPSLCPHQEGAQFLVGEARYDVVIVPGMRTIRSTTLERLEHFSEAGGTVLFAGEIPSLVDARPSEHARRFAAGCECIPLTRECLLATVAPFREVAVHLTDGRPAESLLHQLRVIHDQRFVFFCNTDREQGREHMTIRFRGAWSASLLDTHSGAIVPLETRFEDGETVLNWSFAPHGSLLLQLEPGWQPRDVLPPTTPWQEERACQDPVAVTLAEPNVLVLDLAEYRLNEEEWQPVEEVLRIDNLLRQRLGYPLKLEAFAQPWTEREQPLPEHMVSLKFHLASTVDVPGPQLALENAAQTEVFLDGERLYTQPQGWFVDEAIQTVLLPDLTRGMHDITLRLPYGHFTNLEWCYLLGDFGVEVRGRKTRLIEAVRTLSFGDWTHQGLPFYAGNVTYHCHIKGSGKEMAVRTPHFKAPVLSLALDGQETGSIAFAPFQCELGVLTTGEHTLDITVYGNRVNAFGCLHNADEQTTWFGPEAWRTKGDAWCYEYQIKPMGLLVSPTLLVRAEEERGQTGFSEGKALRSIPAQQFK